MKVQAALVSVVWIALVLTLGLPSFMGGVGVAVAVALAWRDHHDPGSGVYEPVEYEEPDAEQRDGDGIVWL
ncbi:MAG: hypothetical protein ACRDN6_01535 [Gaiellaceae bacterium]